METPALADAAARVLGIGVAHAGWIAAAILLGVLAVLLARGRRERRVYRRLAARLDELEARSACEGGFRAEPDVSAPPGGKDTAAGEAGHPSPTPSRDVLAGMTARLRRLVAGDTSPGRSLAEQAIVSIHAHLGQGVSVESLAAALHVSPRTLQRGLGHALGCTPRQLILAVRMREARRLLRVEGLPVKVVAARLGFADAYHFSHCFTAFYHVPPSRVRRREGPMAGKGGTRTGSS